MAKKDTKLENLSKTVHALVEEIRKELKLDSLQFAPIETVVRSIGLPKCRICTHCFDGSSYDYNV